MILESLVENIRLTILFPISGVIAASESQYSNLIFRSFGRCSVSIKAGRAHSMMDLVIRAASEYE